MAKSPKPKENKTNVGVKNKRKELAAQLGEAVIKRTKISQQLKAVSELCNQLATEIETMNG